jgi:hypothetical protein
MVNKSGRSNYPPHYKTVRLPVQSKRPGKWYHTFGAGLETAILNNSLKHDSPVLDWCASNAVVTQDPAGARKIAKDKSYDRVDGLVALCMALGLSNREPPAFESVYSDRGIITLSAWHCLSEAPPNA